MKKDGRENITTIIHDIKTSYSRVFHEKFPINDPKMEEILNQVAKKVKKGAEINWYWDSKGKKQIEVKFVQKRWFN
jgi:hypothetical protein